MGGDGVYSNHYFIVGVDVDEALPAVICKKPNGYLLSFH
jgi:hypothetical protein